MTDQRLKIHELWNPVGSVFRTGHKAILNGDLPHQMHPRTIDGHIGHGQIDAAAAQKIDGLPADAVEDAQLDPWMQLAEPFQSRQQQMAGNGVAHADAQLAALQRQYAELAALVRTAPADMARTANALFVRDATPKAASNTP